MVPLTIFQRLSLLGNGGGVNTGTYPPYTEDNAMRLRHRAGFHVYLSYRPLRHFLFVTTVTWSCKQYLPFACAGRVLDWENTDWHRRCPTDCQPTQPRDWACGLRGCASGAGF